MGKGDDIIVFVIIVINIIITVIRAADRICLSGNNSLILRVANGRSSPEP